MIYKAIKTRSESQETDHDWFWVIASDWSMTNVLWLVEPGGRAQPYQWPIYEMRLQGISVVVFVNESSAKSNANSLNTVGINPAKKPWWQHKQKTRRNFETRQISLPSQTWRHRQHQRCVFDRNPSNERKGYTEEDTHLHTLHNFLQA